MELEKIVEVAVASFSIAFSINLAWLGWRIGKLMEYKRKYFDKYPKLLEYVNEKIEKGEIDGFLAPFSNGFKEVDKWLYRHGYRK